MSRHFITNARFISTEFDHLLKEQLTKSSNSSWYVQVLVTTNERHKRRIVVEYSQTINRFTLLDTYPLPKIDQMVEKIASYAVFITLELKSDKQQILVRDEDKMLAASEACGNLFHFRRVRASRGQSTRLSQQNLSATFAYLDNITICVEDDDHHRRNLSWFYAAAEKYKLTFNEW